MRSRGFTLLELLIVIAIIGILTTIVLASLNASRDKGRDAARVRNLEEIANALELYYADNQQYPVVTSPGPNECHSSRGDIDCFDPGTGSGWASGAGTLQSALVPNYISRLPSDEETGHLYAYTSCPDGDTFRLVSTLSAPSDNEYQLYSIERGAAEIGILGDANFDGLLNNWDYSTFAIPCEGESPVTGFCEVMDIISTPASVGHDNQVEIDDYDAVDTIVNSQTLLGDPITQCD